MTATAPFPLAARTRRTDRVRTRARRDAVSLLTIFVVLLLVIPSNLVVGPLGKAGTPATIVGLVLVCWWGSGRLARQGLASGLQPVRIGVWCFFAAVMASYVAGAARPMSGIERNGADRSVLLMLSLAGVAFLAADGIRSRARLDTLLRRLVLGGSIFAFGGVVQFFTGRDLSRYLKVPGLSVNVTRTFVFSSGVKRVVSTASHPIEFGMVCALILPIALHYAFHAPPERKRRRWLQAAVIAVGLPMSLSRSAVLGIGVALILLFSGWHWRRRVNALASLPLFVVGLRLAIKGLVGTIFSLFKNVSSDPSIKGRTGDYGVVGQLIRQRPWFGRGFGTFDGKEFRVLDNQYLGTIIETGYVGFAMLFLLFLTALWSARGARNLADPDDHETRHLGNALTATILAAMVSFATFDALSFSMVTGLLFLLIGCCGALWRLERERVGLAEPPDDVLSASPR